jgi:mono/diheme cytochrome c family protein
MNKRSRLLALFALFACTAGTAVAADDGLGSGKDLYDRHCASCHGASGRGDGRVAKSLTVEVPDLTRYAQRRGGALNRELVERIIDGRHILAAHGARTMPVWGEAFSASAPGDPGAERIARLKISRLADHVLQLQSRVPSSSDD